METNIAEKMGKMQKEISISEFFEKNRHLLGYDNKAKAMLVIVKEAVDNSLDACEEARMLPDIYVGVKEVEPEKFQIIVKDNGPGIVKEQVPKIFGTLLYGSKFHRIKQGRGQQGLGISCAVLYSQLTTGSPTTVLTSTGDGKIHKFELKIDVKQNKPMVVSYSVEDGQWRGVEVRLVAESTYREHQQSVLEYLKQTAISNPFSDIIFDSPSGRIEFRRGVDQLPPEPKEIQPHLYGVEIGVLSRMIQNTKSKTLLSFLMDEFSRVGRQSAHEIIAKAGITKDDGKGNLTPHITLTPRKVTDEHVKKLIEAVKQVKLIRPPTDCLSPLGEKLIESGLMKELNPEFTATVTRPPEVYRGWPFIIECGIAYGGSIQEFKTMRFANRVPLLYQGGICAVTKAVEETDWRRYGIQMNGDTQEPLVLFVHMCSVWVPFTSESKEAIANYDIIIKEIKLALQECARKLSLYLSGKRKSAMLHHKKSTFERYAAETAKALSIISGVPENKVLEKLMELIKNKWGEHNGDEEGEDEGEDSGSWEGDNSSAGEE